MLKFKWVKIILTVLLTVSFVFPYPFSFLPWKIDVEFNMNDAFTDFAEEEIDERKVYCMEKEFDLFNYFGLTYSSDGYCKGHIVFKTLKNETAEEDFFLEPGENMEFFSFVDGVRDAVKHKGIKTISVKNLTGENFELTSVKTFNRKIDDRIVYLSNDYYKIGIDLQWGGALSYLEDLTHNVEAVVKDGHTKVDSNASKRYNVRRANKHVNLINCHDAGRLVQQSYYGPLYMDGYPNGFYEGNDWNYNPVQGGNMYNDTSKIVDYRLTEDTIYVKCRPMDWAMTKEWITPSYMEAWYKIKENSVYAKCRYVDYSGYPECSMGVELPAFYCVEPLNQMYYYSGDDPWLDEALTVEKNLEFWSSNPKSWFYNAKEKWAAFAGEFDDSFAIGIFSAMKLDINIRAGVFGRGTTKSINPSKEGSTSYIAFGSDERIMFRSFEPFEYDYCISTGTVDEIRNNFKEINNK